MATLQNIKTEADALKVRCLNEIASVESEMIATSVVNENEEDYAERSDVAPAKITKKKKIISVKMINNSSTWQFESVEDVKRYIMEFEKILIETLEENTIVHLEF